MIVDMMGWFLIAFYSLGVAQGLWLGWWFFRELRLKYRWPDEQYHVNDSNPTSEFEKIKEGDKSEQL